jgi:hypothetical protein
MNCFHGGEVQGFSNGKEREMKFVRDTVRAALGGACTGAVCFCGWRLLVWLGLL